MKDEPERIERLFSGRIQSAQAGDLFVCPLSNFFSQ
jgi:hypothetical protein